MPKKKEPEIIYNCYSTNCQCSEIIKSIPRVTAMCVKWGLRAVAALLVLGFVAWVGFAWYYALTEDSTKRAPTWVFFPVLTSILVGCAGTFIGLIALYEWSVERSRR